MRITLVVRLLPTLARRNYAAQTNTDADFEGRGTRRDSRSGWRAPGRQPAAEHRPLTRG
jgi:hypothetical protein